MGKILYPVGTPVTLRKFPKVEGLIVSKYVKGEKYPYRVGFFEGDEVNIEGKSKFSKAGLKLYNPTQAKADEGNASVQPQSTASCNCEQLEHVVKQLSSRLEDLEEVASNTYLRSKENSHAILRIAEMTDSNFRTVSKQFKALNHDDD